MKKILCFMLSSILLFVLTACSNSEDGQVSDFAISSGIAEEISEPPLEETEASQDTTAPLQNSEQEEISSAPNSPTQSTVIKEQQTQAPTIQPPKPNAEPTEKPSVNPLQEPSSKPTESLIQEPTTASTDTPSSEQKTPNEAEENAVSKINVQVGNSTFTATLADNSAVDALVEMMEKAPVVIQMSDYSGFEKVGSLGTSLPTINSQTTTGSGDIVLYNGNQIVIFYGSNSWSYTRLGKIDDLSGWEEALGSGDVEVTFKLPN